MKRMIHALLAAAVLVSAMTCTAFAATEGITTDIEGVVDCVNPTTDVDEFTAKYSGVVSGEQYVLLVVKTESDGTYNASKAENILYIDQKAATGTDISFDILPISVDDSIVLLGGTFTSGSSPKKLGTLIAQGMLGDVDNNKSVQILDAQMALQLALGKTIPSANVKMADVDGVNGVKIVDAQRILRYALGDKSAFDFS